MGELEPRNDSIFEGVSCKLCRSPFHEQMSVGDQHYCRNVEIVETGLLQSDTDNSSDEDDLFLEGLENLHIEQSACSSNFNKMISQISSPKTSELLTLNKCATMLCSELLQSCPAIFAKAESSECSLSVQNDAEDGVPLHIPSKFVSALKGSRARQGNPLEPNLHVKWAADVYDPPVTSSSHTVKGHRHLHHRSPKTKKDNNKHKHAKSKPSNTSTSSGAERRSSHRRISSSSSILDSRISRLQALPRISLQDGFVRSKMQQVLEESNCGGGFHAKPSWPFSPPFAEAS